MRRSASERFTPHIRRHPRDESGPQQNRTPPCGLKYLRSSGDGTFDLQATITWEIAWTGTGGAGGDLPDGTFGATQAVTVEEIQSVKR